MRERYYALVEDERMAQEGKYGGVAHDDSHTPNDWISIICRHLGLAAGDAAKIDTQRYRKQLLRVAAVCIAAVESLDRQEGREHVAGVPPNARGKQW